MKKTEKQVYDHVLETQPHCLLCGSQNEAQLIMHHIRHSGTRNTYHGNIARLCTYCHIKVHKNEKEYKPKLIGRVNELYGLDLPYTVRINKYENKQ
jgi:hypothetical protein